jgi:hypothetical protein
VRWRCREFWVEKPPVAGEAAASRVGRETATTSPHQFEVLAFAVLTGRRLVDSRVQRSEVVDPHQVFADAVRKRRLWVTLEGGDRRVTRSERAGVLQSACADRIERSCPSASARDRALQRDHVPLC